MVGLDTLQGWTGRTKDEDAQKRVLDRARQTAYTTSGATTLGAAGMAAAPHVARLLRRKGISVPKSTPKRDRVQQAGRWAASEKGGKRLAAASGATFLGGSVPSAFASIGTARQMQQDIRAEDRKRAVMEQLNGGVAKSAMVGKALVFGKMSKPQAVPKRTTGVKTRRSTIASYPGPNTNKTERAGSLVRVSAK